MYICIQPPQNTPTHECIMCTCAYAHTYTQHAYHTHAYTYSTQSHIQPCMTHTCIPVCTQHTHVHQHMHTMHAHHMSTHIHAHTHSSSLQAGEKGQRRPRPEKWLPLLSLGESRALRVQKFTDRHFLGHWGALFTKPLLRDRIQEGRREGFTSVGTGFHPQHGQENERHLPQVTKERNGGDLSPPPA